MNNQAGWPKEVLLCEVGPRDGFQFEDVPIPTALKVEIIQALIDAGLPRIQALSFVHPKWVPQMADAEDIAAEFAASHQSIITALVLNRKGLERAVAANVKAIDVSIATNETHSRDNANMTVDEGVAMATDLVQDAVSEGMSVQIGFQTVFGYGDRGDTDLNFVVDLVSRFSSLGVESISIADSTGLAGPAQIQDCLNVVLPAAESVPVVLHLHDTRGMGIANITAAMRMGVNRFDTSFGGMGGCPFIPGATGNVATEDVAYLCDTLGVRTGIDIAEVASCSRRMSVHRGSPLPGRLYSLQ